MNFDKFVKTYCNKKDNSDGLNHLCVNSTATPERINKDVDFIRTLESKLTIDADFTVEEASKTTPDEEDVFALSSNLFAHKVFPVMGKNILATPEGVPKQLAYRYLDLRSIAAKRSVAQNSIAAIAAERGKGDKEAAQYLKKLVVELGVSEENIDAVLGKEPSYFAQMEVLTKDIYQNPVFYTELYDKPANVTRKQVAIQAIQLMQDRDFFKSQLRTEAVMAVLLETMLQAENERIHADFVDLEPGGDKARTE